jgi:hypothetical protein
MLRSLFSPSRPEIWRLLAGELGGSFTEGGFLQSDKVQVSHGEWTITLDTYFSAASKSTYTRLRAPYINPDGFRFTIYRRGLFSDLAKRLGMQDVSVGHARFDEDFIIKGTDEGRLRALFGSAELRRLLAAQPRVHFTVEDDDGQFRSNYPADTDALVFHVGGVLKDIERLEQLFSLFAETLDQLCRIGSAYEGAPSVES